MTSDEGLKPEGALERSPKAGVGAPSGVDGNGPKRFSVQRKMAIVARLLRGEPLDQKEAKRGSLDLPRFRGEVRSWDQGIWFDGILSSSFE
jgi:hypothetical protein